MGTATTSRREGGARNVPGDVERPSRPFAAAVGDVFTTSDVFAGA
jgi:hypothetical protein